MFWTKKKNKKKTKKIKIIVHRKHHLQLEVKFRALSKNENAVLFLPPTWKK